jgi:hypothetical protein
MPIEAWKIKRTVAKTVNALIKCPDAVLDLLASHYDRYRHESSGFKVKGTVSSRKSGFSVNCTVLTA